MYKLDLERQRNQSSNCQHLLDYQKSKRVPEKHLLLLYWLHQSLWLCGSQQTGKFWKRWEYQTTWPASWENLYGGQEATVRTGHGTTDCFQIRKGVCQGYILSTYIFNLYAEHIMWNAGPDEAKPGIKIAGEIPITSDMQMTLPLWQKAKRN